MNRLSAGLGFVDLNFQGRSRVIATAIFHGASGVTLLDPGPSSTLPVLRRHLADAGISVHDVTAILLTHIHLDHAGATGTLVRENPAIRVYVHEVGAPHMADPARLLASAARLYGDAMDTLWGEFAPVPSATLAPLTGGERIEAGGRSLRVAYTPGHASHHVSYFSEDTGLAFVGDTGGVMIAPHGIVLPPTPPPDIDFDAWRGSLHTIAGWNPDRLFLTHFGPSGAVGQHLAELQERVTRAGALAQESLAREGSDAEKGAWFADQTRRELRRHLSGSELDAYESACPLELNWRGLARYYRKRMDGR